MNKLKKMAFATFAALVSGSVPAYSQTPEIKFQDYPSSGGNMLVRVAIAKGYCEKYGIKCSLLTIASAPLGLQVMTAKSIDVSMTPLPVQVSAVHKGAKVKAIAGAMVENVGVLVVRNNALGPNADKGFPAYMQDFKGKKVGVTARGGSAELQFLFMLEKAGLSADDVTMVAIGGPNTAIPAMLTGQIDAAFSYEPAGAICTIGKNCKVLYRSSEDKVPAELYATNGAQQNFVVRQEMINDSPQTVDAILKALKDAEVFLHDPKNFSEVKAISMRFFKLEMPEGDAITEAALLSNMHGYKVGITRSAVKATVDLMVHQKVIRQPVETERLVYQKAP
jgi:NitT/TauT family transport system substrate-binding protein